MNLEPTCRCLSEPLRVGDYSEFAFLGVDTTFGRYWLKYFVEYEHLRASGRWYMGLIPQENIATITPENAPEFLGSLEWHYFGGSYFGFSGKSARQKLTLD